MFEQETKQLIEAVWQEKYRCKDEQGILDSAKRIVAAVSNGDSEAYNSFISAVSSLDFIPGGRIWAGAGSGNRTTLLNCYVSPDIPDSLDGIMDSLKAAALTMQQGGGIGMDFSTLRPRGARVYRSNSISSGVIPFMSMWNAMCDTIMSAGTRRGAMMATLRCDHPDILEFIECKSEKGALTNFNISVLITDEFMRAVENNDEWILKHDTEWHHCGPTARELWDAILKNTYDHSEPGVIFIDHINKLNNLWYCENIHGTNPCGEQPLPANGNCNLGAINLAHMVVGPFTDRGFINHERLKATVRIGVRFLNNVLDVTNFPLEEQRQEALAKRRLGLGVMGLGTMLQMCCIRYGSDEAVNLTSIIMEEIARTAYDESVKLAKERGPFPAFDKEMLFADAQPFVTRLGCLDERRNSHLLTVAPTGTTSLLAGNVTSGIEPSFAWQYERKMLMATGELKSYVVEDYGYSYYRSSNPNGPLPAYFVRAGDISVSEHIAMQAAAQQWVDSAVSKTVNCPADISFDDFKHVYEEAYKLGCKGCTTYRPSESRGSVLTELPQVCSINGGCSDER